jgi:hypothetical protein
MPVIAGHIAVGVCGTQILGCWVFVMAVADTAWQEGFLAETAFLDLPKPILLLRCQNGQFVLAEVSIRLQRTVLDVQHILLCEFMDCLLRRANLVNFLEDLVTMLYGPDHLVEAVGQDLVNRGGRFRCRGTVVVHAQW